MQLFYDATAADGHELTMDRTESKHIARVLRKEVRDKLHLTDGKGNLYQATITDANPNKVKLACGLQRSTPNATPSLTLAIAPTKSMDRLEWFLEKATEIGVQRFTPLITERSERRSVKMDRLHRIAVGAMKQSNQLWLPIIDEPKSFHEVLKLEHASRLIAHCEEFAPSNATEVIQQKDTIILIGPEGDFSPSEVNAARKSGYEELHLGTTRLRTETAGLVAVTAFSLYSR